MPGKQRTLNETREALPSQCQEKFSVKKTDHEMWLLRSGEWEEAVDLRGRGDIKCKTQKNAKVGSYQGPRNGHGSE